MTSAIGSLAYDSFVDYNCTDDSKYGFDDPYAVITAKYTEEEAVEEDDSEEAEDADSRIPILQMPMRHQKTRMQKGQIQTLRIQKQKQ